MSIDRKERVVRIRESPRMSSPKLGEYMASSRANRRERIIHDQKFVYGFMVTRYADAERAIRVALLSDDVRKRLDDGMRSIAGHHAPTDFQIDSRRNCIEALRAFSRALPELDLRGVEASSTGRPTLSLTIENVAVSAKPAVLFAKYGNDGSVQRGALQLVLRKEAVLDDRGGEAVALLLKEALIAAGLTPVSPKLCLVLDVFAGKIFQAPARSQRLMADVEATCREIANRWPAVAA